VKSNAALKLPGWSGEFVICLLLASLGVYWVKDALRLGLSASGEVGAGLFPAAVGVALTVASLFAALKALLKKSPQPVTIEHQSLFAFGLLGMAALLFVYLGLFVSSFALVFVVLKLMGQRQTAKALIAAVLIAVVMHLLFSVVLGLQLPTEIWELFE
jgi:uncharacterized membrane protein